jgi:hypothetical protein
LALLNIETTAVVNDRNFQLPSQVSARLHEWLLLDVNIHVGVRATVLNCILHEVEEDTCENAVVRAQVFVVKQLDEQTDRRAAAAEFDLKDLDQVRDELSEVVLILTVSVQWRRLGL